MQSYDAIRRDLVGKAALLSALNRIPGRQEECPSLNKSDNTRRQLSEEREQQLADDLAFISATTDDMRKVMAVGLEEDSDGGGLTIRLASNTGDLSSTKSALEDVGKILEEATQRTEARTGPQRRVLQIIVELDYFRILARLRSQHATQSIKTAGRPNLIRLLDGTVNNPSIAARGKNAKKLLNKIRLDVEELLETSDRFENLMMPGSASGFTLLMHIVEQAHDLATRFDLRQFLPIPFPTPRPFDPTLVDFLPSALRKLGRYYAVSWDLVNAARNPKYTLFKQIVIEVAPQPEFDYKCITSSISSSVKTTKGSTGAQVKGKQPAKPKQASGPSTPRHQLEYKVHAEIQLLFFYESNPHIQRPRVLCASKSACYLCHLFIQLHGKFRVPRTHGALWTLWALPDMPQNAAYRNDILSTSNLLAGKLEAKIKQAQSNRNRRVSISQPNESFTGHRQAWSTCSTLLMQQQQAEESLSPLDAPLHTGSLLSIPETSSDADVVSDGESLLSQDTIKPALHLAKSSSLSVADSGHAIVASAQGSKAKYASDVANDRETNRFLHAGEEEEKEKEKEEWACYELTKPDFSVDVRSEVLHLQLSWEGEPVTAQPEQQQHSGACLPSLAPTTPGSRAAPSSCWVGIARLKTANLPAASSRALLSGAFDVGNTAHSLETTKNATAGPTMASASASAPHTAVCTTANTATTTTVECSYALNNENSNNSPYNIHNPNSNPGDNNNDNDEMLITTERGSAQHEHPLLIRTTEDLFIVKFAFDGPPQKPSSIFEWCLERGGVQT